MPTVRDSIHQAIPNLAERELDRAFYLYIHGIKGEKRRTTAGKKARHEARLALQTAAMDLFARDLAGEDVTKQREKQAWLAKRLLG